MKKLATIGLTGCLLLASALVAVAITADEILDEMDSLFAVDQDDTQGVLATMAIHNEYSGDVTSDYTMALFERTVFDSTQPEDADETSHVLMYFMGGDEEGSIFLLQSPEQEDADSRMWLYLPALGLTKELVSDEDQSGSFAGSSMSYGDLGGTQHLRDDYDGTILREDVLEIEGVAEPVWVLELAPKPGVDADYAKVLLWVAQADDLSLRMESYDGLGTLVSTMEFASLGEFEGDRIPEVMRSQDLEEDTITTVTITGTRRPDAPLAVALFDPTKLGELDPSEYGF